MDVLEIAPGLWRWTGYHEEWKEDVGCVYCETEDGVVLVDPLVPPEDAASASGTALDRDVERVGRPVHVLVTVFWHTRSAAALVERYDARVWAPTRRVRRSRAAPGRSRIRSDRAIGCPGGSRRSRTARRTRSCTGSRSTPRSSRATCCWETAKGGMRMCPESWLPGGRARRARRIAAAASRPSRRAHPRLARRARAQRRPEALFAALAT